MKERIKELYLSVEQIIIDNEKHKLPWIIRILTCVILCVTTAVLVEFVVFQFHALTGSYKPIRYEGGEAGTDGGGSFTFQRDKVLVPLSEDETKSILVERNNQKLLSDYLGTEQEEAEDESLVEKEDGTFYRRTDRVTFRVRLPRRLYISKLDLRVALTEEGDAGYSVSLFENGEQKKDTVYCSISPRIGAGIANIGSDADELEIALMTSESPKPEDIFFTLSNEFSPNLMRILFISLVLLLLSFLAECRYLMECRPEWCFAFICFGLGLMLICGIGTNQVSYDEHVHAKAAYKLSFGQMIETTETALEMSGNLLPFFHNPEERELVYAYENLNHDYSWADIGFQSRMVRPETRVYYPMALGFFLGRILKLSFPLTVALAKLGNLLLYIAVCFFAIRLAERYKELVCLVALLPNCVFQASSLSYDAVVNSFLLLGSVLLYNEFLEPDSKLKWQRLLAMLLAFVIGCQSKPIYILMVCMLLFLGRRKFENPLQEWICKLSVLILAGLMIYNIFKPTPAAASDYDLVGNFDFAGDKRSVGSSVTGQISYILHNPGTYTLVLLAQMGKMLYSYLIGGSGFFQYGYVGSAPMAATWVILALALYLGLTKPLIRSEEKDRSFLQHKSLGTAGRILTIIMCFGLSAVIWTSMYVSYTAVGASEIRGVQGRYFTPLFLPLLLCLCSEKRTGLLTRLQRNRLMLAMMAGLNLLMILFLVVLVYDV